MTTRVASGRSRLKELEVLCERKESENELLQRRLEEVERDLADARRALQLLTNALRRKGCCQPPPAVQL